MAEQVRGQTNAIVLDKGQVVLLVEELQRCLKHPQMKSAVLTITDVPEVLQWIRGLMEGERLPTEDLPGPRFVYTGTVFTIGTGNSVSEVIRGMGFDPGEAR